MNICRLPAAIRAMREAGCCELTMKRVLEEGARPGALWHIYDPHDSDKIRDLLSKVGIHSDLWRHGIYNFMSMLSPGNVWCSFISKLCIWLANLFIPQN